MKTESVRNITVCSNMDFVHTSVTPKTLKIYDDLRNLYIDLLQKEWVFYRSLVKNDNYFR